MINLEGKQYERWTVLKEASRRGSRSARHWTCQCTCGKIRDVLQSNLTQNLSRSCGCLMLENSVSTHTKHGASKFGKETTEYVIWKGIRKRCRNKNNPRYKDYGGRGICVCERWNSFKNFLMDVGPRPSSRHSIDRIDNNGNYEPSNCRWATNNEQTENSRRSLLLTYNQLTLTASQWEKELNLPHGIVRQRIRLGWNVERTLCTPPQR